MLAGVSDGKKRGSGDEVPYARYAFLNPYNISLMAGAATTAAATGHWEIGLIAGATEALWMLFAPGSKLLQRLWFDPIWEQSKADDVDRRRELKFQRLTPMDQQRAFALREQRARIYRLATDNPSLTVDLLTPELAKLDTLYEDFLDLALVCASSEKHLGSFDVPRMENSWKYYEQQKVEFKPNDQRYKVATKNLEVITQRMERLAQVRKNLQTSRGQMDLM